MNWTNSFQENQIFVKNLVFSISYFKKKCYNPGNINLTEWSWEIFFQWIEEKKMAYEVLQCYPWFGLSSTVSGTFRHLVHICWVKLCELAKLLVIQGDNKKTCQLVIFGRNNTAKFTKICI